MKRCRVVRLSFEQLEERSMLAGDVLVSMPLGKLSIVGDAFDNELVVIQNETGNSSEVVITGINGTTINGADSVTLSGAVKTLKVDLKGGNDNLSIGQFTSPFQVNGTMAIKTGAGADSINLFGLNVTGKVVINTGDDADQVAIDDSAFLKAVSIDLGKGDDVLRVERRGILNTHTAFGLGLSVVGGDGNDVFEIAKPSDAANLVTTTGKVVFDGKGGFDVLDDTSGVAFGSPPLFKNLELLGVSPFDFNPLTGTMQFPFINKKASVNDWFEVSVNGEVVPDSALNIAKDGATFNYQLAVGRNDVLLSGVDDKGKEISRALTVWAGNHTLTVTVLDADSSPVAGAVLRGALGDDERVFELTTTDENGVAVFRNVSNRTILLTAQVGQNAIAATAVTGDQGLVTMNLEQFGLNSLVATFADSGFLAAATTPLMTVATAGEGPQTRTETFAVPAGTSTAIVRFQFITSEVPGGFFGSRFNDSFSVSIHSRNGNGLRTLSNTMNGLGLAAFDASGATEFFELSLPVGKNGDSIDVKATVTNVGDGLFDSQVIVERVERTLEITSATLNDIDNNALQFLSAAADNPYFGGNTRVHGKVSIKGADGDALQKLELQVLQNGGVVATANLAASAASKLLKPFGKTGKLSIDTSQLLFQLSSAQAAAIDVSQNGSVVLRLKATTVNGEEATRDMGTVQLLTRYTLGNRYGQRDATVGGDDWILPSVKELLEHYSGITWGDMSNMNGGPFSPHASHQRGVDVDGHFANYNNRNAATAAQIIAHLNDPTFGSRIDKVFVTYTAAPGNSFFDAINGVVLDDGRLAVNVIRPVAGHTGHFHWRIIP